MHQPFSSTLINLAKVGTYEDHNKIRIANLRILVFNLRCF